MKDMLSKYKYEIKNVEAPNLYKSLFPYSEIPKIAFDNVQLPMNLPKDIWITDTTFRDGQQSMAPFTEGQIIRLFDYLHELDNGSGIIKMTEFFLYTEKDRKAAEKCLEKGYEFPKISSWIRAKKEDFKIVKDMGIKETGMLMSCSDYHIFKKLNMTRQEAADMYISVAEEAVKNNIVPRCHLEDITRADFYGFVVPFVNRLMELSRQSGVPIKIRACDTLGLGVSYPGASLPRSVQGIMHGLIHECGVPSEWLEWHGHNDFYNAVSNSTTAWLHGCGSVNTTLLGIGERTGNCPLEAMIIQYAQLMGTTKNMNVSLITEIAQYFKRKMGYKIAPKTPFIGEKFNVTRAGIHADGILKDEEIYNIFDTEKILNRPIVIAVNQYSGLAGAAAWINTYFRLKGNEKIDKRDERVHIVKTWIDEQYDNGRSTSISDKEMKNIVLQVMPELAMEANVQSVTF